MTWTEFKEGVASEVVLARDLHIGNVECNTPCGKVVLHLDFWVHAEPKGLLSGPHFDIHTYWGRCEAWTMVTFGKLSVPVKIKYRCEKTEYIRADGEYGSEVHVDWGWTSLVICALPCEPGQY
jgi:hypothetical protein